MGITQIPSRLRKKYSFQERDHAIAVLATDFPSEWSDILACLDHFVLKKSEIVKPGGARSDISKSLDNFLQNPSRGWVEKKFDTKFVVDGVDIPNPTHKVDCFKNRVAV